MLQIPFSFGPLILTQYYTEILVYFTKNIFWVYPIEGVTEVKSKDINYIFKTKSKNIIQDCALYFNFLPVDQYILKRQYNFLFKFVNHPPSFLSGLFNQGARIHMEAISAKLSTYYDHN